MSASAVEIRSVGEYAQVFSDFAGKDGYGGFAHGAAFYQGRMLENLMRAKNFILTTSTLPCRPAPSRSTGRTRRR